MSGKISNLFLSISTAAILFACENTLKGVSNMETTSENASIDQILKHDYALIDNAHLVSSQKCGPFIIEYKSNSKVPLELTRSVPDLSEVDDVWPGFFIVYKAQDSNPYSEMETNPKGKYTVYEIIDGKEREVEERTPIQVFPEDILEWSLIGSDFYNKINYEYLTWAQFLPRALSKGDYILRFNGDVHLRWSGGECSYKMPDLEFTITD